MKSIGAVLAVALIPGACSISGPKVKAEPAIVKVKPVTVEVGGSRSDCPPGHAKKNWR
jgi:hypothetical protein